MMWNDLDKRVKIVASLVGLFVAFYGASEFIAAVKMAPTANAKSIVVVSEDVDDVENRVQRMEKRYNKHIETEYRDWKMNKKAPPTTVKQPTPPPRPN